MTDIYVELGGKKPLPGHLNGLVDAYWATLMVALRIFLPIFLSFVYLSQFLALT